MGFCRMCDIYKEASDPKIQSQIKMLIEGMASKERVSDKEYARRLDICGLCDRLSGNTCLACGCFVELRAAGKASHCSKKKW
ncbi:MAG: hypothetical protein II732_04880 [Lachnospiraceae bacterium]|nr:hypothetical protein [Lachnospiraceae bacterium]